MQLYKPCDWRTAFVVIVFIPTDGYQGRGRLGITERPGEEDARGASLNGRFAFNPADEKCTNICLGNEAAMKRARR